MKLLRPLVAGSHYILTFPFPGRHIAYKSKFWKARREKGFKIDSYLRVVIHVNHTGHNG